MRREPATCRARQRTPTREATIEDFDPRPPDNARGNEPFPSVEVIRERFRRRGYRLAITPSTSPSNPRFMATAVRPFGGETFAGSAETDAAAAYLCWIHFQDRHERYSA
jgi:hypothetical protein